MSGPTIYGSNGKEQFTTDNPAIMQLPQNQLDSLKNPSKQDVSVKDSLPAGSNTIGNVQTTGLSKIVTLANAIAITDTNVRTYSLILHGGLTEDEIRKYRTFKVSLVNTHNQSATIKLATAILALGSTVYSSSGEMYLEANNLGVNPGRLVLQGKATGTGANNLFKTVPSLDGIHSNLFVNVQFPVAPTSGSLTLMIEMGG